MCSRILSDYGIIIDNFHVRPVPRGCHFFLTHFHRDHTSGLGPKWNHPTTIHTSETSFKLMEIRYGKDALVLKRIRKWLLWKWKTIRIMGKNVNICAVPANHSPGSVMWCFILPDGSTVVHTGDYRPTESLYMWDGWNKLRPLGSLFYDSSLHDPKVSMPTLEQSVDALESVYKKVGKLQKLALVLHTSGIECLIVEWCKKYNHTWDIHKSCKHRMECELGLMETGSLFQSKDADILCVGESFRDRSNGDSKWIFVKPSLIWFMCHAENISKSGIYTTSQAIPDMTNTFRIFYSNHASFEENKTFIAFLQPMETLGCVDSIISKKTCFSKGTVLPNWNYLERIDSQGYLEAFNSTRVEK